VKIGSSHNVQQQMQLSEIEHKQLGVLVKQKSDDQYQYLSILMPREEVYQAKD